MKNFPLRSGTQNDVASGETAYTADAAGKSAQKYYEPSGYTQPSKSFDSSGSKCHTLPSFFKTICIIKLGANPLYFYYITLFSVSQDNYILFG